MTSFGHKIQKSTFRSISAGGPRAALGCLLATALLSSLFVWPTATWPPEAHAQTSEDQTSSVPDTAIRMHYNCADYATDTGFSEGRFYRDIHTMNVFSSRSQSDCSRLTDGDLVVVRELMYHCTRPVSTYSSWSCDTGSTTVTSYIVGFHPDALIGENPDDVYDFDLYIDGNLVVGISLPGIFYSSCDYNPEEETVTWNDQTVSVTSPCQLLEARDNSISLSSLSDVRVAGLNFRSSRISTKTNELPPGKWWVKLCYNSLDQNYSDGCPDLERTGETINFRMSNTAGGIFLLWDRDIFANQILPNSVYLRDLHGNRGIRCPIFNVNFPFIPTSNNAIYICAGYFLPADNDFIVLGSDMTQANKGGTITEYMPEIEVIMMEVNQSIQNWKHEIDLIRNKRTAVRVFIVTKETNETRDFSASLRGIVVEDDEETPFENLELPVNRGETIEVSHTRQDDYDDLRVNIDSTLNFILPEEWISIAEGSALRLELVFDEGEANIDCGIGVANRVVTTENQNNYMCSRTLNFVGVNPPDLTMAAFSYTENAESTQNNDLIDVADLREELFRIESILPFPAIEFRQAENESYAELNFAETFMPLNREDYSEDNDLTLFDATDILLELYNHLDVSDTETRPLFLGVLPGDAIGRAWGLAHSSGRAASWYTDVFGYARNRGAHELAHLFGRPHPGGFLDGPESTIVGACGEHVPPGEVYPYFASISAFREANLHPSGLVPVLGNMPEMNNTEDMQYDMTDEIWGLDTRFVNPDDFTSSGFSAGEYDRAVDALAVINPRDIFSLMSYCDPNMQRSQGRWVDRHNYEEIMSSDNFGNNSLRQSDDSGNQDKVTTSVFSGRIYLSRDGVPESVELNPVHSRLRVPRSVSASGDYSLEFRDASGGVLRSVPFSAEEGILDINPEQDIDFDAFPRIAFFSVLVSSLPDFASVVVVHSDSDLAVFESSSSTPSVTISGVAAGQVFAAVDTVNLSWSGSDADGEDLDYLVYYSVDGGAAYRLIYLARDDTSKDFDAANLKGSSRARFGVSVSDGIRSVFAETPVFAMDGKAPVARITSPGAGSAFAGKQGFLLDGWAHDTEDGFLGSSSFNWSSSLDGNLGTGSYLVLSADELTAGNHQITLTVTDSDNMTSTAAIPITVNRQNQLPVANDDNIRVALDETALFDVLANDIDVEGDFRHDTLRILIPPSLGTAQILIGSQGKPVLSYTAGPTGKDALIYLICDGINRCATATVTIYIHADDCTIMGTEGDDRLRGTSERDVICALGGDDEIDGRGGDDIIRAGSGNDTIYAQTGNDTIYGGRGHDAILGHRGNDIIYGGLGDDEIWGGGGDDTIWGGFGADEIRGEADNDTLHGEDGPDLIHGGRGNDTIYGGTGNDTIRGNHGTDIIFPGEGDNTVLGISSEDSVF